MENTLYSKYNQGVGQRIS